MCIHIGRALFTTVFDIPAVKHWIRRAKTIRKGVHCNKKHLEGALYRFSMVPNAACTEDIKYKIRHILAELKRDTNLVSATVLSFMSTHVYN